MRRRHNDVFERVLLSLCEYIDTPRALSVWLSFKHNQRDLVELPSTDFANNNTFEVASDYFITELLSKAKFLKTGIETKDVALGKWRSAECACVLTNARFRQLQLRPFTGRVEAALFGAQRKIAAVLGPLNISNTLRNCKWGPGATYDLKRKVATPDNKISQPISVTRAALPYLRAVVQSDPHWASEFLGLLPEGSFSFTPHCRWFSIVRGSRLVCVPKNAKTDRIIAVEPTGNQFLQQGVHDYIRRRLRKFGINLDDQSINQVRAQEAFRTGLSTLDLSAASDTIAREVVYHLLPLDWALYLDSLRSQETEINGEWIRTEKFVSMGNAFCFELETLIFWALASSVEEIQNLKGSAAYDAVTVYGDDIIVPRFAYDSVVEMLTVCGFSVNADKSYRDGNFFESCGKHYHRSIEVTPSYQKEELSHPSEVIRAHNRLLRFSHRMDSQFGGTYFSKLVSKSLRILRNSYPLRPFPRIPYGVDGDDGFLAPLNEFQLDKNHGYRCHVLVFVRGVNPARESALYAYKLRRFPSFRRPLDEFMGDHSHNVPTNLSARGHAGNVGVGQWRTRVRYVPEFLITKCDEGLSSAR